MGRFLLSEARIGTSVIINNNINSVLKVPFVSVGTSNRPHISLYGRAPGHRTTGCVGCWTPEIMDW